MNSSVSVSIAFEDPADESMVMTIAGGIRIEVDGIEVTKLVDQEECNIDATDKEPNKIWWYDHTGQPLEGDAFDYKGSVMLFITISSFAKNVLEFARGSPDRFEQLVSEVGDSPSRLVLSYLDGDHDLVRVAYQSLSGTTGTHLTPPVQSAVGYAVPLSDLCGEVARCLTEFREYTEAHATDAGSNSWYQEQMEMITELEQFASGEEIQ